MDARPTPQLSNSRRNAILALSLIGAAAMAATSLLQLGIVDDLPDPRFRLLGLPFRSKKVNLSDEAHVLGVRDGPVGLGGFLANLPFALALGRARPTTRPWLAFAFATKALGEAVGAAVFFAKMPRKEKAWCVYCIAGAIASVGIFALSAPVGARALASLRSERG